MSTSLGRLLASMLLGIIFGFGFSRPEFAQEPPVDRLNELLRRFRSEFVVIKPGEDGFPAAFMMGGPKASEQPVHEVRFTYGWEISRYEVTQDVFEAVMGYNPARWKGARNAVEMVSFDEAIEFCRRVTRLLHERHWLEAQQHVRLPTEAEWEYCARAGTTTDYCFGDDPKLLDHYAWFRGNAAGNDPPVGVKRPNQWGLYDMHGYVWEWCLDWVHEDYRGAPTDGAPWLTAGDSSRRVIRGGSWKDEEGSLRSASRSGVLPHTRTDDDGMMLLKEPLHNSPVLYGTF